MQAVPGRFRAVWRAKAESVAGAGVLLFALKVAGCALGLSMHLVLARLLGTSGYGSFATAFNAASLIALFAACGMPLTASRFLPAHLGRGERAEARGYIEAVGLATVLGGLCGSVILLLAARLNGDPLLSATLAAASPLVLLLALGQTATALLQALQRPLAAEFPILVLRPLLVISVCGLMLLPALGGLDAAAALLVLDGVSLALLIPVGLVLWRTLGTRALNVQRRLLPATWLPPGLLLLLLVGGAALNERMDIMAIAAFADPELAGIYSAAARFAALVSLGTAAATVRALPTMAEQFARGARQEAGRALAQTSWTALCLAAVAGLPLLAGSGLLLGLFGPGFREGVPALCLLVAAHVALAAGGAASSALIASGNERHIAGVTALGLLVNAAGNLMLVPSLGMNGAASATLAAMATTGLGLVLTARRVLGLTIFTGRDLRR